MSQSRRLRRSWCLDIFYIHNPVFNTRGFFASTLEGIEVYLMGFGTTLAQPEIIGTPSCLQLQWGLGVVDFVLLQRCVPSSRPVCRRLTSSLWCTCETESSRPPQHSSSSLLAWQCAMSSALYLSLVARPVSPRRISWHAQLSMSSASITPILCKLTGGRSCMSGVSRLFL